MSFDGRLVLSTLGIVCGTAMAQLDIQPRSYVFLLQDTRDADWYVRAFDESGEMYSELLLNVGRLPTYTGFAVVGGRLFATTYDLMTLVEFDPLTGDQIASYPADPGEIVIGLDSDQRDLFVNGFNETTAVYSVGGELLGSLPKPDDFTGGGLLSVFGASCFYFDEQLDTIVESDKSGNVLDTIAIPGFMAFPDGLDYDPSTDEFLLSGPGVVKRFDRQGNLLDAIVLNGFGPSFHNGFEYFPDAVPGPATLGLLGAGGLLAARRRRIGRSA